MSRPQRALERRILKALEGTGGMPASSLCKPTQAPSARVKEVLQQLAKRGLVQEAHKGNWKIQNAGRAGRLHWDSPPCRCGAPSKRAFAHDASPEWACTRCDHRWPRIRRLSGRPPRLGTRVLDQALRDLSHAARCIVAQAHRATGGA